MSTVIKRTGLAMVDALQTYGGGPLNATDIRDEVSDRGADPDYVLVAAKWLRDEGVMTVATKARHNSEWSLAATPAEIGVWVHRVQTEAYSEVVSQARSLKNAGAGYSGERNRAVAYAVNLGVDLGKSAAEVLADCEPKGMDPDLARALGRP